MSPERPSHRSPGAPPAVARRARPASEREEIAIEVELLTPMLGGGAEMREPDPVCWLRPASVRGHLRFWWRATQAHRFGDVEAMRDAEAILFGASARFQNGRLVGGPGIVSIRVRPGRAPQIKRYPERPSESEHEYGDVAYLLFPAQKTERTPPAHVLQPGGTAQLVLRLDGGTPEQREQAKRALVAWLVLGGAGSRTRRGLGALGVVPGDREMARAVGLPTTREELEVFLRRICSPPVGQTAPRIAAVFTLSGPTHSVRIGAQSAPRAALCLLASCWKKARQDREDPGKGAKFGRSRWPEADAIRRHAGTHAKWLDGTEHAPRLTDGAPRACLGLPIGMQFIDAKEPGARDERGKAKLHARGGKMTGLDPSPAQIVHDEGDRFASPVLLRPVRVWEGDRAVAIPVVVATLPMLRPAPVLRLDPKIKASHLLLPVETPTQVLDRVLAFFSDFDSLSL